MPGYVTFRLDNRIFALRLDQVREIVRLVGLEALPGARAPMAGVIDLRGNPLPVLDVRAAGAGPGATGDVLVMDLDGDQAGFAVDEVIAVLSADELPVSAEPPARSLPQYVVALHCYDGDPVLVVDVNRLVASCAPAGAAPASTATLAVR
jgi:two-component system chemotaxis response regulator CheV